MKLVKVGRIMLPAVLVTLALLIAVTPTATAQTIFETSPLTVVTATARHAFTVEIARTPSERRQGLMFRTEMEDNAGMLFDYGRTQPVAMWMKNTLIPLDMLFIGADGRIVNIARNATPGSLANISSVAPVLGVLELNAGTATRLNIRRDDRVEHKIFRPEAGH